MQISLQDDAGEDKIEQLTKYISDEIRLSDKGNNTNQTDTTEDVLALKHLQFLVKLDIEIRLHIIFYDLILKYNYLENIYILL